MWVRQTRFNARQASKFSTPDINAVSERLPGMASGIICVASSAVIASEPLAPTPPSVAQK
eukprot:3175488-Amphidinium_carterae.1